MRLKVKQFYLQKPCKSDIQFIQYIANMYEVELFLKTPELESYVKEDSGACKAFSIPFEKKIYLSLKDTSTVQELFKMFFHELQHCINFEENKFINFHKKPETVLDMKKRISLTLRAEQYTDQRAAQLQSLFAPNVPYIGDYKKTSVKKQVRFNNTITKLMLVVEQSGHLKSK